MTQQPGDSTPLPEPNRGEPGHQEFAAGHDDSTRGRLPKATLWIVAGATLVLITGTVATAAQLLRDDGEQTAAAASTEPRPSQPAQEPRTAPEPEPAPEPDPDGTVSGRCSDLLGDRGADRYKLLATLDAENTGNIGIIGEVWVEFDQIGAEPIRFVEEVEVPVGETVTVYVDEPITREQWHRHLDAGSDCDFGWDLTDIFGEVAG